MVGLKSELLIRISAWQINSNVGRIRFRGLTRKNVKFFLIYNLDTRLRPRWDQTTDAGPKLVKPVYDGLAKPNKSDVR